MGKCWDRYQEIQPRIHESFADLVNPLSVLILKRYDDGDGAWGWHMISLPRFGTAIGWQTAVGLMKKETREEFEADLVANGYTPKPYSDLIEDQQAYINRQVIPLEWKTEMHRADMQERIVVYSKEN